MLLSFPALRKTDARKPLAAQLAIAPLGGLLACIVFFLFVTARFDVIMALPSVPTWPSRDRSAVREPDLRVHLGPEGYVVVTAGRDRMTIPRLEGALDVSALCSRARRELDFRPDIHVVRLVPDDGVPFAEVTSSYDALLERRCAELHR